MKDITEMTEVNFPQWVSNLSINAANRFNRQLVILQGSYQWADKLLKQISSHPSSNNAQLTPNLKQLIEPNVWYLYSDKPEITGNVNKQTFRNKLGTESRFVVFYSDALNIDALAALSGTLVSGGILFIVLPAHIESSIFLKESCFNQRLVFKIFNEPSTQIIKELDCDVNKAKPEFLVVENQERKHLSNKVTSETFIVSKVLKNNCLTEEQLTAVNQVIQVVKGHRNRPLLLTADRGRGKSSALAIACAYILINTNAEIKIAITATHRKSLNVFFTQLIHTLGENSGSEPNDETHTLTDNVLEHINGSVQFLPVDELIKSKTSFNLVLVDEAASIPLYLLDQILVQYHRLVFASTVHGYEGAGRSFSLKFKKNVIEKYPESRFLHIRQPIRWAENDPLERFIYDLCLLNAELPQLSTDIQAAQLLESGKLDDSLFNFNIVETETLMLNESVLQQVFAVLVTAHYQTSPNDLQLLLDNNNITLVTLSYQDQIAGVALLLREGVDDITDKSENNKATLKTLIQTNQRRLKNQFIPQSLLTHCGEDNSFDYSYLRIMRIAILPNLQGKGLGTVFLSYIEKYAAQESIDFIGTSFGVTQPLLNFWQQQLYKVARIGFTKDKASGEHSALLLKVINNQHKQFVSDIEYNFYQSFDYLLAEQYRDLDPALVWQILHYCPLSALPVMNEIDIKSVEDFYTKKRQYSVCVFHLHKWLQHQMKKPFNKVMLPIISKVFQKKEVSALTEIYGFTGKKAFNHYLIQFTQDYSNNDELD